jgi:hypothetical protein
VTECNPQPLSFSTFGRRRLQLDFAGGTIASHGGLPLLREVERHLGLIRAIDRAIPDPRDPDAITHDQYSLLAQRIYSLALGHEDLNDPQTLRFDPLLQLAAGRRVDPQEPLGSPPTLCRLENRISRQTLVRLHAVLVEQFIASFQSPPQQLILDFDATDARLHGKQEKAFFHGYYDSYCYLPLYVFCGDEILAACLRPANGDPAKHAWAILKLLVQRLRQAFPQVRIILRGDGGFCRWKMMRWCDRQGVGYILGLARNPVLEKLAQPWTIPAAWHCQRTGQKQRFFGSFSYAAKSWDRPRRVIVKAEHTTQGPNPRFVVSNCAGDEQALYDQGYCPRGEMENRIKEQQLQLFADRTSCHGFAANAFRLLLSAAAYTLVQALRRTALAGTELQEAQVATIRLKLFQIGARVVASVRRVVVHLASSYPGKRLFEEVARRLLALPERRAAMDSG